MSAREPRTSEAAGALPREAGAYALILRLDRALVLDIPRFRGCRLAPGLYAYFGSARGPGGLAARVGRHLRSGRRPHWHVDRLLTHGTVMSVLTQPHGSECGWRAAVQADVRASVPLRGFGSSDCRGCPAHLLTVPDIEMVDAARPAHGVAGLAGPWPAPR